MGQRPCPFPSRVCEHPQQFFGTCLKPEGVFEEGLSSILYTMNEEPLAAKPAVSLIMRIIVWPSFKLPTMSRFEVNQGKVTEVVKGLRFTSRTSLPEVLTSSIWQEADKPLLAQQLSVLKDSYPKAEMDSWEDGTSILVEVLEPGKPYRAYYFHDSQDAELYREILDVITPSIKTLHFD